MYHTMPWGTPPAPGTTTQTYSAVIPAYHAVPGVRQSFGQQPLSYPPPQMSPSRTLPQQPQPASAPPKKKIEWPSSVREYVQRSFLPENSYKDVNKPEVETKLKQVISEATDNGTLHSLNWDTLPLPQEMVRKERAELAAVAWRQQSVDMHAAGNGVATAQALNKKRKSQDIGGRHDEALIANPPWRTANTSNALEDRITQSPAKTRFDKRQQPLQDDNKGTSKLQKNMEKRQRKFDGGYKSAYKAPSPEPPAGPVVGTCQVLEKQYFRLTAPPVPSQVRPEYILRQTLDLLKEKWRKEGNYGYICDQFKSMRQDLTVQRIKNDLTVSVYEIHARIALEKGDLGEYNQCQTQLRVLYAQNLGGRPVEFKAYRILYFIHTANRTALNDVLADLTIAEKGEKAIKHALDVRSALALGNYHRFFRLYLDTPNMGAYLMDMFVVRERLAALSNLCKAYKPDVKLRFVTEELGFESDAEAANFIMDYNGEALLEEKDSELRFLTGKAKFLFEAAKTAAFQKIDIKGQI